MVRIDRKRRLSVLVFALAANITPVAAATDPLTLEQAVTLAEQRNSALRAVCALESTVQGEFNDSRALLWNNPEITIEHRRHRLFQAGGVDVQRADIGIGISQKFELGGQQTARRDAAKAGISAVEQTIEDTRREVRAEVETRFAGMLAAQQRVQVDEQALDVLRRGAELVGKRVQAGENSRLDGNLALVEAYHARKAEKEPLIFVEARPYSASFYSQGEAQQVNDMVELKKRLENGPAIVALKGKQRQDLPIEVQSRMHSVGRYGDYELFSVIH